MASNEHLCTKEENTTTIEMCKHVQRKKNNMHELKLQTKQCTIVEECHKNGWFQLKETT